jgi:Transposase DNA-binding/Transposase Tn5 dimerisation domain
MNTHWAEHELSHAALPDRRLKARLVGLAADLANQPTLSLPEACGDWAATKAAYRFFDNDRIPADAILDAHRDRTRQRLPTDGFFLAIQDTTDLDFTSHSATTGLGYLGHPRHFGLLVHSTLVATPDGVPLGLLHQQVWARDVRLLGKRKNRRRKETKDKESQRWLDSLQAVAQAAPLTSTAVVLGDREADFYDLFAAPRPAHVHLLVRARSRRRVRHEMGLLGKAVAAQPAAGAVTVTLPRRAKRPARPATLTVRFGEFLIEPPSTHPRRKELAPLRLWAVQVEEETPPAGEEPVRWLLLTTLPVTDLAEAVRAVVWYTRRWLIERYHYTLKSGCRLERLALQTAARLRRALAVYAVVAWRLLWLTYEARAHPEASCVEVLQRAEWQVLHRHVEQAAPAPAEPPTLREAVRMIARLGGFLARTNDGEPGVQVIWRGLRRLHDLVAGWRLAQGHLETPARYG